MLEGLGWFLGHVAGGVANVAYLLAHPELWANFGDNQWLAKLIYYGGSAEFFFIVFDIAIVVFILGYWRRKLLWSVVRGIERLNNAIGRAASWALLIMVLQQVIIVALQRIFRVSEITVGPFGYVFTKDLSWFGEELKLYNAMLVALCAAYTFVQGGHVRVDLIYAATRHRTRCLIDMAGSLLFVLPMMTVIWHFGWFFLWRHLVTPKIASNNSFELILRKSKLLKWNVETIGFSPNGFDGYFLFKVLLVAFAALMFLQGLAFFYRRFLEFVEGPDSVGRYMDHDRQLDFQKDDGSKPIARSDHPTPTGPPPAH